MSETRASSFALRVLTLVGITIFFIFSLLVILDNEELKKLIPHTTNRSLALLFGYGVAVFTSNYYMAIRGENFTDWRTEILISLNAFILLSIFSLPHLFPRTLQSEHRWWEVWEPGTISAPNPAFYFVFLLVLPLLLYTAKRVYMHFVSVDDQKVNWED